MVGPLNRQSTLFYVAFGEQAALIKDEKLDAIDVLLHDEELIELVRAQARVAPQAVCEGWP